MSRLRHLASLGALALAAGLTGCGGGAGASGSTASTRTPSATAAIPTTSALATRTRSAPPSRAQPRALVRRAGRAAPFLVPAGDNSIPTYGAESSPTQRSSAGAALRAYLAASARGHWRAACFYMGSGVRGQLEALARASKGPVKGCVASSAKLSAYTHAAERADPLRGGLAALRVKGERAFALFHGPHGQRYMVPMVIEAGAWKVNQIQPIPYPVGAPVRGG